MGLHGYVLVTLALEPSAKHRAHVVCFFRRNGDTEGLLGFLLMIALVLLLLAQFSLVLCVSASLWRYVHQLCASASLREKKQHIHPCTLSFRVILCILWLLKNGIVIEIIVSVISCVVINITQSVSVLVKSNEMQ